MKLTKFGILGNKTTTGTYLFPSIRGTVAIFQRDVGKFWKFQRGWGLNFGS